MSRTEWVRRPSARVKLSTDCGFAHACGAARHAGTFVQNRADRGLRSVSNRRVFAVGDVADPLRLRPRYFTLAGRYHAGIVIRRAVFRLPARFDYAAPPRVLHTEPELAKVGLTERAAAGVVTLVVTPRGRLIGAGILSRAVGDMISLFTLAITRRLVRFLARFP